jgi:hypothetical protein
MATALRGDGSCTTASRGVKKRHFFAIYIYNASIYQDRLGTNIGKTQKKSDVSSGGWLRTESGGWREPTPHNNPHNLFPQRLAAHDDPTVRRLFCLWSPSMCEFAASSFDPAYRSSVVRPTFKGSPDPALRLFDERQEAWAFEIWMRSTLSLVSGSLLATRVAAVGLHQVLFVHDNAAKVSFVWRECSNGL